MARRKDEAEIRKSLLGLKLGDDGLRDLLVSHKTAYPDKYDYGLGKDGYTLEDSQAIKEFYEELGIKTWAEKKPRTRVGHYKKAVGRIVDGMIECLDGEDSYLGRSCYHVRVSELVEMTQAEWIGTMLANFHLVNPTTPKQSQKKAWRNCFSELKKALKDRTEYHGLTIIFEYVISGPGRKASKANPGSKGKRPDAIALSKTAVAVIEFKGYDLKAAIAKGEDRECANYATRIAGKHAASQGMRVGAILVLEGEKSMLKRHGVKRRNSDQHDFIWCCSPDRICEAMAKVLGRHPKPHPDISGWLDSPFI